MWLKAAIIPFSPLNFNLKMNAETVCDKITLLEIHLVYFAVQLNSNRKLIFASNTQSLNYQMIKCLFCQTFSINEFLDFWIATICWEAPCEILFEIEIIYWMSSPHWNTIASDVLRK